MKKITLLLMIFIGFVSCRPTQEDILNLINKNEIEKLDVYINKKKIDMSGYNISHIFNEALNNEEILKLLIESELFNSVKDDSDTISTILNSNNNYNIKRLTLVNGTSPDLIINYAGEKNIISYWLLEYGVSQDIDLLLEIDADFNSTFFPTPAIITLVENFESEDIAKIIEEIDDIDAVNEKSQSALFLSIINDSPCITKLLLDYNANPINMSFDNSWFTLMRNSRNTKEFWDVAKIFNNNLPLAENSTEAFKGLLYSRFLNFDEQLEVLRILVSQGFNRYDRDENGLTPYEFLLYEYNSGPSIEINSENEIRREREWKREVGELVRPENVN